MVDHPLHIFTVNDVDVRVLLKRRQTLLFRTDRHGVTDVLQMIPFLDLLRPCVPRHTERRDHQNASDFKIVEKQIV